MAPRDGGGVATLPRSPVDAPQAAKNVAAMKAVMRKLVRWRFIGWASLAGRTPSWHPMPLQRRPRHVASIA
jgi:hypothetical protein